MPPYPDSTYEDYLAHNGYIEKLLDEARALMARSKGKGGPSFDDLKKIGDKVAEAARELNLAAQCQHRFGDKAKVVADLPQSDPGTEL